LSHGSKRAQLHESVEIVLDYAIFVRRKTDAAGLGAHQNIGYQSPLPI
jgi:hypothetical protein